jgi:uncharacterized cysteine cluster protein YcgN (CxxCxxCC family)
MASSSEECGLKQNNEQFWRDKSLDELNDEEWEALCDGCGQWCLIKLQDEDTDELLHTRLACKLLDIGACSCTDYANRHKRVHDCVVISPESVKTLDWLPHSCAYRLVAEGKDLNWWHPLVSGDPDSVHEAGVSVRPWATSEEGVPEGKMIRFVVKDPSIKRILTGES